MNIAQRQLIINKLKNVFADHVGINNPISSESLFTKITGTNPDTLDYYEKEYKWNAIKRILGALRKSGELFVIMGVSYHYVLNDKDELDSYKHKVDATIKGLHNIKKKAEIWVDSKELKKLKKLKKKKKKVLISQV